MILGDGLSVSEFQARLNGSTRGQWDWYARHRVEVEKLIRPEGRGGRIRVLGAGNCNDLDLKWLCGAYADVRVVDIDRGAVERAVKRQGVAGRVVIEEEDLTGIASDLGTWKGREVSTADVELAIEKVMGERGDMKTGDAFDRVLSPCVLSQLLVGARDVLGQRHPRWPALKAAMIRRHVRQVVGRVRPGGRGVLIVDLSSTGAIPGLDRSAEREWPDLMRVAVRDGRCFRGLEPAELEREVRREMGAMIDGVSVTAPWVWHLGWGKAFLCYGMVVRRR